MNEQLQQALAAIMSQAAAGVEAGAAFLQTELPDVIQQLLLWKACASAISMLGFLAVLFAIYKVNALQLRWWFKDGEDRDFIDHPQLIANLGQALWIVPLTGLWSLDWLQIWLAPKIYLIEYAASLAK